MWVPSSASYLFVIVVVVAESRVLAARPFPLVS